MDDQLKLVRIHLERLRRHYEVAVRTYDEVALLDLSHALRIWTELGQPLVKLSPSFSGAMSFKTGQPGSRLLKVARGHPFIFATLPGGVITYAANGEIFSDPTTGLEKWSTSVVLKRGLDHLVLQNFCLIHGHGERIESGNLSNMVVKRCNFRGWMAAETLRMSYVNAEKKLLVIGISREMLVKRVANTLDGSHASAAQEKIENKFDSPIHQLMQFKLGGLPLPYFILLKIAQDILHVAPRHLE